MKKRRILAFIFALILIIAMIPSASAAGRTFTLKKVGGGYATEEDCAGKTTVFVFMGSTCGNSANTMKALSRATWIDPSAVQIVCCIIDTDSEEEAKEFYDNYSTWDPSFLYTYGQDSQNFMWPLLAGTYSVTLAVAVVIEPNGTVKGFRTTVTGDTPIRELLNGEGDTGDDDIEIEDPSTPVSVTYSGTADYTKAFEVFEQLNALRRSLDLDELVMDKTLLEVGMQRAAECAVYYGHSRPDGTDCFAIFPPAGAASENIAAGYMTATDVMQGWINSASHYRAMTNPDLDAVGIGCFRQANGAYYWTQVFTGRRQSTSVVKTGTETKTYTVTVSAENLQLSVDPTSLKLKKGAEKKIRVYAENIEFYDEPLLLDIRAAGSDAELNTLVWSSSDPSVASVASDGTVTALAAGEAEVILSTTGGDVITSVKVTVEGPETMKLNEGKVSYKNSTAEKLSLMFVFMEYKSNGQFVRSYTSGTVELKSNQTVNCTYPDVAEGHTLYAACIDTATWQPFCPKLAISK